MRLEQWDHAGGNWALFPQETLKRTQSSSQNCPERKRGWGSTINSYLCWLRCSLPCISNLCLWIWTELSWHFREGSKAKTRDPHSMLLQARCGLCDWVHKGMVHLGCSCHEGRLKGYDAGHQMCLPQSLRGLVCCKELAGQLGGSAKPKWQCWF